MSAVSDPVLDGVASGAPLVGPRTVHIDVTNACNAACITCWDHSPLLREPRPIAWKRRRIELDRFSRLVDELAAIGSVRQVIVSGMGDPLVHPDIYAMLALVKEQGWHLTVLSNLIAADIDRLVEAQIDQLLVGVHGATPRAYAAFHPGWSEREFFTVCRYLRRLAATDTRVRHVQVINRDTAEDLVAMVGFADRFGADRVNYKLASLYGGTEDCSITAEQLERLRARDVGAARALAAERGVATNLDLFERQLDAAAGHARATTPIEGVGCFMGYLYTRITVDLDVLYCCNTAVRVGNLERDGGFAELWSGPAWQELRDRLRAGRYLPGCDKCGKFEQNLKWSSKVREHLGDVAWRAATGQDRRPEVPRTALQVIG